MTINDILMTIRIFHVLLVVAFHCEFLTQLLTQNSTPSRPIIVVYPPPTNWLKSSCKAQEDLTMIDTPEVPSSLYSLLGNVANLQSGHSRKTGGNALSGRSGQSHNENILTRQLPEAERPARHQKDRARNNRTSMWVDKRSAVQRI